MASGSTSGEPNGARPCARARSGTGRDRAVAASRTPAVGSVRRAATATARASRPARGSMDGASPCPDHHGRANPPVGRGGDLVPRQRGGRQAASVRPGSCPPCGARGRRGDAGVRAVDRPRGRRVTAVLTRRDARHGDAGARHHRGGRRSCSRASPSTPVARSSWASSWPAASQPTPPGSPDSVPPSRGRWS